MNFSFYYNNFCVIIKLYNSDEDVWQRTVVWLLNIIDLLQGTSFDFCGYQKGAEIWCQKFYLFAFNM